MQTPEPSNERPQPEDTSLMATVGAIVEAVLERQGIMLLPQKRSRWKANGGKGGEAGRLWRNAEWKRAW